MEGWLCCRLIKYVTAILSILMTQPFQRLSQCKQGFGLSLRKGWYQQSGNLHGMTPLIFRLFWNISRKHSCRHLAVDSFCEQHKRQISKMHPVSFRSQRRGLPTIKWRSVKGGGFVFSAPGEPMYKTDGWTKELRDMTCLTMRGVNHPPIPQLTLLQLESFVPCI